MAVQNLCRKQLMYCLDCLENDNVAVNTVTKETRHYLDEDTNQPIVDRRHLCPCCGAGFYTREAFMRETVRQRPERRI